MSDGSLSGDLSAADACGRRRPLHAGCRGLARAAAAAAATVRRRDLTPDRMWSHRNGAVMHVEIAMEAMPAEMVHLVEGNLRQVVGVQQVSLLRPAVELRRAA